MRLLFMRLYWAYPTAEEHGAYTAQSSMRSRLYSLIQSLTGDEVVEEITNRGRHILRERVIILPLSSAVKLSFQGRYDYALSWVLFGEILELDFKHCSILDQATELLRGCIRRMYDSLLSATAGIGADDSDAFDQSSELEVLKRAVVVGNVMKDRNCWFRWALCVHSFNLVSELCFEFSREVLHVTPNQEGPLLFPASSLALLP